MTRIIQGARANADGLIAYVAKFPKQGRAHLMIVFAYGPNHAYDLVRNSGGLNDEEARQIMLDEGGIEITVGNGLTVESQEPWEFNEDLARFHDQMRAARAEAHTELMSRGRGK